MNRQGKRLMTPLVLVAIFLTAAFLPVGSTAAVAPNVADFGEVPINSSSTIPISLTNNGSSPMNVFLTLKDKSDIFSISTAFINLTPGQSLSVAVTFLPTEVGIFSNVLYLLYSQGKQEEVALQGEGVSVEEERGIKGLLDFFDQAVEGGTLMGYGPGKSADGRLNALRDMLVEAAGMEESGDIEGARGQLLAALKKLEEKEKGKSMPFAVGEDVPELISMIQETVENLGQASQ